MILVGLVGNRGGAPWGGRSLGRAGFPTLMKLVKGSVAAFVSLDQLQEAPEYNEAVIDEVSMPFYVNTKRVAEGDVLLLYQEAEPQKAKRKVEVQPITTDVLRKKAKLW